MPTGTTIPYFAQQATDLVGLGRALPDEFAANAVQGLHVLLCGALDGHKAHGRAPDGFADRFGIVGVVLLALDVGFDELRRDQLDRVPQLAQFARPVMRAGARFHADQAGGLLRKIAAQLSPRERSLDLYLLEPVHTVHLKHLLCQIHSNARKVHLGLLPSFDWLMTTPVWHTDAGRGEESIPLAFAGMTAAMCRVCDKRL